MKRARTLLSILPTLALLGLTACADPTLFSDQEQPQENENDTVYLVGADAAEYLELSAPYGYSTTSSCPPGSGTCMIYGWIEVANTGPNPVYWWRTQGERFHYFLLDDEGNRVNAKIWSGGGGALVIQPGQDTLVSRHQAGMSAGNSMPEDAPAGWYGLEAVIFLEVPDSMDVQPGEVALDLGQVWWPFGEGDGGG